MMKLALSALAALALSACAHTEAPSAAAARGDIAAGQHLAEINCSACHAIGAEGESRHAAAAPFRTLSENYPINALEEAFAEGVLVGHRDMPEFTLEPAEIDDLLAYIQSVQERRGG